MRQVIDEETRGGGGSSSTPPTGGVKQHVSRNKGRYLIALVVLVVLAALATAAQAGTATVSWTNPTQNTDGSAIPSTGPGSLTSTRIEWGTCSGTAFGSRAGDMVVNQPATSGVVQNLAPGTWCFRAY